MAILITGGARYIGSHMVHELADRGEQPVVIDDFSSGFEWANPSGVLVFVEEIGDQRRLGAQTIGTRQCKASLQSVSARRVMRDADARHGLRRKVQN
jgi:UDP-glucose 4-epimerase